MADLKTNYVDDVLDTTKNQLRKYQQIQNDDGTVSFVDVTEYTQVGTSFGAKDINDTNAAINDVNRNLSVRYNADTDTVQIYYNGTWTDWSAANLQVINLFVNGNYVNGCALAGRDAATQTISNYLIINGQPSGVFVGIMISIPNIIDHIVAGKKLHITCKLDKYDSSSLLLIIDSATSSSHNSGKQVTKTISTTMTEYVFDLKNCGFSNTYKNLYVGLYSYVGCPYYNLYIEKMWLA